MSMSVDVGSLSQSCVYCAVVSLEEVLVGSNVR
jgi:hypothetical protein